MANDQRCCDCRWFRPGEYTGACHYPLTRVPTALMQARHNLASPWPMTTERNGTGCPTFERKEPGRAADAP